MKPFIVPTCFVLGLLSVQLTQAASQKDIQKSINTVQQQIQQLSTSTTNHFATLNKQDQQQLAAMQKLVQNQLNLMNQKIAKVQVELTKEIKSVQKEVQQSR